VTGGLGSAVADLAVEAGLKVRLRKVGIPDVFCESGSIPYLVKHYQMGAPDIAAAAREVLR
jgi:transketolase